MVENGPPDKANSESSPPSRATDAGHTASYIKIFLACMAGAVALGLIVGILRPHIQRLLRSGPPSDRLDAVPGYREGMPASYRFYPLGGVPFELRTWGRDLRFFMGDSDTSERLVEEIERQVSSWRQESATSRINEAPAGVAVTLPDHIVRLMQAAVRLHELTAGAFNPAVGPAVGLWREAARRGTEPAPEEIAAVKDLCTLQAFTIDTERKTCTKTATGARLDFGGLAKGYIVDQIVAFLQGRGVTAGMVTAGTDARVFGGQVSRKVPIMHPEKKRILYGYLYLREGAVATTNLSAGSLRIGEKVYSHVIDPRTLRAASGLLSASVIAGDATTADGLATGVFVLGVEAGRRFVERLEGVEALFLVAGDGEIRQIRTRGFPAVKDLSAHNLSIFEGALPAEADVDVRE